MLSPLANAAPIQTKLMGHPWQVINQAGFVIGHYRSPRTAADTAYQFEGCTVRWVG